ncbi:site-specific DNA-methyltransferase [Mesotoga sp.]|uniref:site-specific DNA-methyltransferase n=1 Tax=Mesotoga sp. TaxID=2053577 RepID=UPI00345ED2EB
MDKMKQETADLTQENIALIGELFPNVITEIKDENGKLKKGINFELLKQELSGDVVDGEECYDFTWVGKKASIVEANTPIRKTLRPCIEESKNWETTENLYIEGDNLDVLKLLQESYLNSVKMIYIDPPYNTGKDFIYKDKFMMDKEEYKGQLGTYDEVGNRLFQNTETNGRFHSDWCSMMYPRLKLARSLLAEDGVICMSIDDNELDNLKKICSLIFGESNFEGHIHWRRRYNQPNDKTKMIGLVAEHLLVYAKDSKTLKEKGVGKIDLSGDFSNPDGDPLGDWASKPWRIGSGQSGSSYRITTPSGLELDGEWMGDEETFKRLLKEKRIIFPRNGNGMPRKKYYRFERENEGQCATNWWSHDQFGHNQGANNCLTGLFGFKNIFDNPKPVELLRALIQIANVKSKEVVLDFFSGSATTAHAVMQLNAEDGGNRKFIMVQLPEPCDEKSEAFKAGYKNICEIGKERIRRAGDKINKEIEESNRQLKLEEEPKKPVDIGFRVLKVDTTNMKDIYYAASEYTQNLLTDQISNIKDDRTDLDLLYGVLLEWGLPLSLKHEIEEIDDVKIHIVDNDSLIACFSEGVPETVVREIAKRQPRRAVFRDSSFASSSDKINVEEIFKLLAPNTSVKVI